MTVLRWVAPLLGFVVFSACATWLSVRLLSDLFRYVDPTVAIYVSVAVILGVAEFMHLARPAKAVDDGS